MAFAPAWLRRPAGSSSPGGSRRAASACPPDAMRAPVAGLTRRPEFLKVAARGRKSVMPGLILQACRRCGAADAARVGFTASKRVGGAVERNRARRRLRAAVAAVMPQHARQGHDYVVIARTETLRRPFSALVRDLETALRRLDTWRDN